MNDTLRSLFKVIPIALVLTLAVAFLDPSFNSLLQKADNSAALGPCDNSFFTVSGPVEYTFEKSCLQHNTQLYTTDNRFLFFQPDIPYKDLAFVRTPNSEIKDSTALTWSITLQTAARVYIMPRHIPGLSAPGWITGGYTRSTNNDLSQISQYVKRKNELGLIGLYDLYSKTVPAGTLTLYGAADSQNPAYSMYIVALSPIYSSPSPSPTLTPSPTPTRSPSPTPTPSPSASPSPTATPIGSPTTFNQVIEYDLQYAVQQYDSVAKTLSKTAYPVRTGSSGTWTTSSASSWTSGFFPGSLWYLYEYTKDPIWATRAQQWQAGIESQKNDTSTHDLGFMIFDSFGNGYKQTSTDSYKQVVLTAANSLSQRYSPIVGATRSWNSSNFTVIIDNMMNIEMLYWAAKNGGNTQYTQMATSHALKTAQNHVRADGSTFHVVDYNPNTGAVISQYTHQGYSDSSTWSRGQAWAIYGFTMAYRETGDTRFLETARKTANYYLAHIPNDIIPSWDFQAPGAQPKDSSAASIAASGLLELAKLDPDTNRKTIYRDAAKVTLLELSGPGYLTKGTNNKALLLHGTQNKPSGNYDTGLVFGDYYFIEALLRYKKWF